MWRKFCGWLLKMLGWTVDGTVAPEPKCILLGVPHTSIWDFVICYLFYKSVGGDAKVMIKKEVFFWPLGPILKAMGGVPVDRSNATQLVLSTIHQFQTCETLHMAMCPEGTRTATKRWKLGFYKIATQANVPVYLSYVDWGTKHVGIGRKFELTGDPQADLLEIRRRYRDMHLTGLHKDGYTDEI